MFELHDMVTTAERFAVEGSWVEKNGSVDGQDLIVLVGVGQAAANLRKIIRNNSIRDPRSTAAED